MPRRGPSAAAPSSTTIGWEVNGTGVNGSGMLTWAAVAVRIVTKRTAPICSATRKRASARAVTVSSNVGCMKTFAQFGLYGASAITAVTAQSTKGIEAIVALEADFVTAQIEAVAGDFTIDATKIGMLANAAIVEAVAAAIAELDLALVVLDPVLVSSSGERLLDEDGVRALCAELLPRARVLTPN